MSTPRRYQPIPDPEHLIDALATIKSRCTRCPECDTDWLWNGVAKDEMWRAYFQLNGVRHGVRRTVYAATARKPLLDGQIVATKCECPNCLNPELLFAQTRADKLIRQIATGGIFHAQHRASIKTSVRANGIAKLNVTKVQEIRSSDESSTVLAERFGVSPQTIRHVRSHKTWNDVTFFAGLGARHV